MMHVMVPGRTSAITQLTKGKRKGDARNTADAGGSEAGDWGGYP